MPTDTQRKGPGDPDHLQAERGGGVQEPRLELLSSILDEFNKTWGN